MTRRLSKRQITTTTAIPTMREFDVGEAAGDRDTTGDPPGDPAGDEAGDGRGDSTDGVGEGGGRIRKRLDDNCIFLYFFCVESARVPFCSSPCKKYRHSE